jgi:preprotein translocase subunit YajC
LQTILILVLSLFFGVFVVKIGMDNSKSNQYTKEMLEELREIKEILRDER